ncbi:MAG: hypothetical protein JWO50_737 [Candidatus Kaiserbacteria bacterium]|nr:hypothetical protein [Candidatus Kaiserbacteria bacterium]
MSDLDLSAELNAFIEKVGVKNGFELSNLPENALFEIHTRNSVYTIVVLDPQNGAIALMGSRPDYKEPDIFAFFGSSFGMSTSVTRVGWVGIGLHFRMRSLDGGLFTTTEVKHFVMLNDPSKALSIRKRAEAKRPDALIPETEDELALWQKNFDKEIESNFAGEYLPIVQKWLAKFCINGKCRAATFFFAAKSAGRLKEALLLMPRHYKEHWMYKHPDICGDLITPSDTYQWEKAYKEAGIPAPS